jgi:hypothetical protein
MICFVLRAPFLFVKFELWGIIIMRWKNKNETNANMKIVVEKKKHGYED